MGLSLYETRYAGALTALRPEAYPAPTPAGSLISLPPPPAAGSEKTFSHPLPTGNDLRERFWTPFPAGSDPDERSSHPFPTGNDLHVVFWHPLPAGSDLHEPFFTPFPAGNGWENVFSAPFPGRFVDSIHSSSTYCVIFRAKEGWPRLGLNQTSQKNTTNRSR